LEDLLAAMRRLTLDQRRMVGLAAVTAGVAFVWMAKALGA
jgi:hypothetical protein